MTNNIRDLVDQFVQALTVSVQQSIVANLQDQLGSRPTQVLHRSPGKAIKVSNGLRKKMPGQLCPVPGCKSVAAPVYKMVCKDHKDLPQREIKKYREDRRAQKMAAKPKRGPGRPAAMI